MPELDLESNVIRIFSSDVLGTICQTRSMKKGSYFSIPNLIQHNLYSLSIQHTLPFNDEFHNLMLLYNITGSRSTFEFPSRVNFSGPSLYCIARTLDSRTSRCNKVDAARLQVEFTFTNGSEVRYMFIVYITCYKSPAS